MAMNSSVATVLLLGIILSNFSTSSALSRSECRVGMNRYVEDRIRRLPNRGCNLKAIQRTARSLCLRGFCDPDDIESWWDCYSATHIRARWPRMLNRICGLDQDGDEFGASLDCDDRNATIFPGALELPFDDVDSDCDGLSYPTTIMGGKIQITLYWEKTFEALFLLSVKDPAGRTINERRRSSPTTGGIMETYQEIGSGGFPCPSSDDGYFPTSVGLENVLYDERYPGQVRPGTYRVRVRLLHDCGYGPFWVIRVAVDGQVVASQRKTLRETIRPINYSDPRPDLVDELFFTYDG